MTRSAHFAVSDVVAVCERAGYVSVWVGACRIQYLINALLTVVPYGGGHARQHRQGPRQHLAPRVEAREEGSQVRKPAEEGGGEEDSIGHGLCSEFRGVGAPEQQGAAAPRLCLCVWKYLCVEMDH